jgi:hypothetical protein
MTDQDKLFRKQAETLAHDLFVAAEAGRVTYKKPINAKAILARYKDLHNWDLPPVTVRLMVNYLRCEGIPIGSNPKGYFYILDMNSDGAHHTMRQIESRLTQMVQAYAGIFPEHLQGLLFRLQAQAKHPKQQLLEV